MFLADEHGQSKATTAIYWAARILNEDWVQPGSGEHAIFTADSSEPLVAAYPIRRPDQTWSVLLINKDPKREYRISLQPNPEGAVDVIRYSRAQYRWKANGADGHPIRNDPPARTRQAEPVILPPYSITVVRYHARP